MKFIIRLLLIFLPVASWGDPVNSIKGRMMNSEQVKIVFTLKVTNEKIYSKYREIIKPLMDERNVKVVNEYRIKSVVHSSDPKKQTNLIAVFLFPSSDIKKDFFQSEEYQKAKKLFHESTENFELIID